eukprot:353502-Chlamydomonas_euryale.AAC.8
MQQTISVVHASGEHAAATHHIKGEEQHTISGVKCCFQGRWAAGAPGLAASGGGGVGGRGREEEQQRGRGHRATVSVPMKYRTREELLASAVGEHAT